MNELVKGNKAVDKGETDKYKVTMHKNIHVYTYNKDAKGERPKLSIMI